MGDRAMAEIKTTEGSLYFYTHWCGSELPDHAEQAVKTAAPRKGDDAYALRIVVDQLIKLCGARDKETGAGLMLKPYGEDSYNGNKPSVTIDISTMVVTVSRYS
jgi:hypothetical protein